MKKTSNIITDTKFCSFAYRANLSRMCKKMLGMNAKKPIGEMSADEKRAFWCVMNVFRRPESHHRYAHKSGRGMRIIEQFIETHAK